MKMTDNVYDELIAYEHQDCYISEQLEDDIKRALEKVARSAFDYALEAGSIHTDDECFELWLYSEQPNI